MAEVVPSPTTLDKSVEALIPEEKPGLVTQLYDAVRAPDFAAVKFLLNKGVDVTTKDPTGEYYSPRCLEIAITNGQEDIACLLIKHTPKSWKGVHFDRELYDAVNKGMMEIARLLIEKEDQNQKTRRLSDAVKKDFPKVAEFLLEHGAQIDWQNDLEQTALFEAVENGHRSVAEVLLRAGASLDITKRDGKTVFDVAMSKDVELARIMLDRFCSDVGIRSMADINLDLALRDKDYPKALDLLQNGADIALRTIRINCQPGGGPLIGLHNEYFTSLCSTVVDLQQRVASESKQVQKFKTTESDQHFLCASKWLVECLSQHSNCIKAENALPLLPSRVIDVGSNDSQETILILSEGRRGRYVALSHRWGSSNITKTTKKNITHRLSGIAFHDLTKTMQDAVTITRRLGVRYLWIDAVCIIQDSHSDWSVESCNMAEIYRNALFTIAAAAAADHSEGCFASRDKAGPGGQLDRRGWILQEQLLSRRILTYSRGTIEWQCLSSSASSDDSHGYGLNDSIRFKRALFGFRSTSMTLQKQAYASWQDILSSYSNRSLTNESDKLMAILGIAKFIEATLKDTFLSGLWKDQLYRDLLWSSSSPLDNSRIKGIELPSWSWASVRSSISHSRWPAGSTPTYLKPAISLISTDLDRNVSNDTICKSLTVKGILQKVHREPSHNSSNLFPWKAPKKRDKSPLTRQTLEQAGRELKDDFFATPVEKTAPKKKSFFGWPSANPFGRRKDDIKPQSLPLPKERDIGIHHKPTNSASLRSHGRSLQMTVDMPSESHDLGEFERHFTYWSGEEMFGADRKEHLQVSAEFWPDINAENFDEAWVLPVATEHYWMHCIVLVSTNIEQTEFRRIGRCHVDHFKRTQFFFDKEEKILTLV